MLENDHTETWKPYEPWRGRNLFSNHGRRKDAKSGKLLTGTLLSGYVRDGCVVNGRFLRCFRHTIIAELFIGPRPQGKEVNHKNGKRDDNLPGNLEWVTRKENLHHAIHTLGHWPNNSGTKNNNHRFSEADVIAMRAMHATGNFTYRMVGEVYGTDPRTALGIICRKSWAHI